MIAYTELEYGLFSWPITLATSTLERAAPALSSAARAAGLKIVPRVEKLALRFAIASQISGLIAGLSAWVAAGHEANAWGFA
jgi:hypothetical protein